MQKPNPQAYGLPSGYDWKANKGRIESRETAVGCVSGLIGWGSGCALGVLIINLLYRAIGNWALWTLPFLWIGCIAGVGLLVTKVLTPMVVGDGVTSAKAYGEALEAYEYNQLETGIGFWRALRGVPFERAIMRLFNQRGAKAQMTSTTGDGGIDIILTIAGQTFWCQCKGLAAPVSVAPIREIAGVCSKGDCRPVVFAVNGYTKAARETATRLGVKLVDAPQIASLARMERVVTL